MSHTQCYWRGQRFLPIFLFVFFSLTFRFVYSVVFWFASVLVPKIQIYCLPNPISVGSPACKLILHSRHIKSLLHLGSTCLFIHLQLLWFFCTLRETHVHLVIPHARIGTRTKETGCIFRVDSTTTNKNKVELLLSILILICLSIHFCTNPRKSTWSHNYRKDLRELTSYH